MEHLKNALVGAKEIALDTAHAIKDEVSAGLRRPAWWVVIASAVLLGQCL